MSEISSEHFGVSPESEIVQYRALSGMAVAGLICGLLSPLVLIEPLFWLVALLGIILSLLGVRQVSRSNREKVGRAAAVWGLTLSILFAAAGPANSLSFGWLMRREARQFAAEWFAYLAHDEPHKAYQLIRPAGFRQPLDDRLWDFYRGDPRWEGQLIAYAARPLVHTLLALGENARVHYWETVTEDYSGDNKKVCQVYSVTYQQGGSKRTFFVALEMERERLAGGRANWRLVRTRHDLAPNCLP